MAKTKNEVSNLSDYYVYVYIDPRNYEEFYYGKGRGPRKFAHLKDKAENKKTSRIAEIRKAGLEPIIRVIARGLTAQEALLVEKTLLWKLGKWTLNVATGHFADKFRPRNTYHKELPGFDSLNGLYYFNVGENVARNWDDYVRLGYISAGWGAKYRDTMLGFCVGDVFVAYLKSYGYVGIGRITARAKMIKDVKIGSQRLLDLVTSEEADHDVKDSEQCEYACLVKWIKAVPREKAIPSAGHYTTPMVRASLDSQPDTVDYLEREFGIAIRSKLK